MKEYKPGEYILPDPEPKEKPWPPRVWIHALDRRSVVPVHALILFEPGDAHHEYISLAESQQLEKTAADRARAEALEEAARMENARNRPG